MKAILKKRNGCAMLFVVSCFLTGWFAVKLMVEATLIFGMISAALLVLLIRKNILLSYANLIRDNCILSIPSAIISTSSGSRSEEAEEIVVSTFGILTGSTVYKWGTSGVNGVRLRTIEVNPSRIFFYFGDEEKNIQVELLHGMVDLEEVVEMKEKFWRETGVKSVVKGW